MRGIMALVALVAPVALTNCTVDPPVPADETAAGAGPAGTGPSGAAATAPVLRAHEDRAAGVRFPVPLGAGVTAHHFDPAASPSQIRHELTVTRGGLAIVRVDLWDDPRSLPLDAWLDEHLAFLLDDASTVATRSFGAAGHAGREITTPRSPQALGRITAVFGAGRRVVRVTCLDADDASARAAYAALVAGMTAEGEP